MAKEKKTPAATEPSAGDNLKKAAKAIGTVVGTIAAKTGLAKAPKKKVGRLEKKNKKRLPRKEKKQAKKALLKESAAR